MLASARACHQPMRRNDMIPTPSQPINNWKRLLAVIKKIIASRNVSRYLKKLSLRGSACMYQDAKSRIDQVT